MNKLVAAVSAPGPQVKTQGQVIENRFCHIGLQRTACGVTQSQIYPAGAGPKVGSQCKNELIPDVVLNNALVKS
jgi:hypothetical protein